jgi:large subunit ribosomal protein L15
MTARKRSKNSRQRGTHTHGWGSKKKHRGAGNRGGRGMAGTGKRGDAKKPRIWKDSKYFGKHGFKKKNIKAKIKTINIRSLVEEIPKLISRKKAAEKAGVIEIELEKIGYNKLLSNGRLSQKLKITTPYASPKAVEKIKAAGGDVVGLAEKAKPAKSAEKPKEKPEKIEEKEE